jgi:retinol dehydrogenase-14
MTENFPGPMAGKTALVTGGTGGIGRAAAADLAAPGARVGITGRDKARTQAAATGIVRESGNPAVDAFADMSCQAGARALAVAVRSAYPRLDVLASNVGGSWATRHLTADGLERTFAVSHLAAFLLTGLVLDRLKGSAPARIVAVSSNAQAAGRLNFDDRRANVATTGSGRTASPSSPASCSPTNSSAGWKAPASPPPPCTPAWCARRSPLRTHPACRGHDPVLRPFMKAPARGAATSIYLASAPEAEGVTGRYFANRKSKTSSKASYDTAAAARLWPTSADLTGLNTRSRETQRRGI